MPTIGVFGFFHVIGNQRVEFGDSLDTVCDPASREDHAFLIDDADIVVLLGPVDPDEDQTFPPLSSTTTTISLEEIGGVLMDRCS